MVNSQNKQVVLAILDGWGLFPEENDNAIIQANTPVMDTLSKSSQFISLQAAGEAVGLPWGEMGNSEVGHINIGSGRVVLSDYSQISQSIQNNTFYSNPILKQLAEHLSKSKGNFHIMGLLSNAGVHGHIDHLLAAITFAVKKGYNPYIHLISDGRDSPPESAKKFLKDFENSLAKIGKGQIATICGRYFTMDRDKHWDRIQKAYNAMVLGKGNIAVSAQEAIETSYKNKKSDEFIEPTIIGQPEFIKNGDALLFTNFRADRAIQITKYFLSPKIEGIERVLLKNLYYATMTEYEHCLGAHPLFSVVNLNNPQSNPLIHPLGEVISQAGLAQLHIAETEKYAHVTYFFNAGREEPYPKEKRILVPSPRVATYDKTPQMSAAAITTNFIKEWEISNPAFTVINYANADMVGHTGELNATIKAIETVDSQLGIIAEKIAQKSGILIITSDHGNAELLKNPENHMIDKEHSINPVPLIIFQTTPAEALKWKTSSNSEKIQLAATQPVGLLADIAPTILELMGLQQPTEMTGQSLCGLVTKA